MPEGQEIDRAVLWKKAREDKTGNIPDLKAAEKAKLIDDLQKQVSEGTLTVSGSNDILTLALETPEHGGRVRGAGAGITPTQFFNLPKQQRVKFSDKLKESVREAVREETLRIEAKSRETIMEAVRVEREAMLAYIRQLVPNFDPSQMLQTPISPRTPIPLIILPPQDQSPKNPMSDKASCSGATNIRPLALELEDPKPEADTAAKEKALTIHMPKEVFGFEHDTFLFTEDVLQFGSMVEIGTTVISVYMRFLFDFLKMANIVNLVGLVDPGLETAYYMNSLPKRMVDDEMKNIVNTSIKMFNIHINKNSRKQQAIWKNLHGTPEQPTSVECGYYVMRFMRDIIHDPDLNFEKMFDKKKDKLQYKQEDIHEVRHEWAEFVNKQLPKDN
ncbi:hypothetical protein ACE6H2_016542 [Prunus campanulata]